MKKCFSVFATILMAAGLVMALPVQSLAADQKIGYVDLARTFDDYQKTKDFDKALEAKGNAKQAERDRMVADVKKMRDEAELLAAKAKDDKQAAIDAKIKTLQEFDRVTRDALRKERDSMVQEILKEIETVIQGFGKSQGYSFIFNDRVLVYKGENSDLTAQVTKALNDSYSTKKK